MTGREGVKSMKKETVGNVEYVCAHACNRVDVIVKSGSP